MRLEAFVGAFLIRAHQARIAHHIGGEDRGQSTGGSRGDHCSGGDNSRAKFNLLRAGKRQFHATGRSGFVRNRRVWRRALGDALPSSAVWRSSLKNGEPTPRAGPAPVLYVRIGFIERSPLTVIKLALATGENHGLYRLRSKNFSLTGRQLMAISWHAKQEEQGDVNPFFGPRNSGSHLTRRWRKPDSNSWSRFEKSRPSQDTPQRFRVVRPARAEPLRRSKS